jgi:DNA-binding SARP family transcriptional activator
MVIRIRTLGRAEIGIENVERGSDPVFGPGKPIALLVWLASLPDQSCRRDQAIDLLWSDVEPERARHALRQTIWDLRRRIDDQVVISTRESLSIGLELRRDHVDFLTASRDGRFEDAVALYHGDFLPDLSLPGGVYFEHWADAERNQLRLAYQHAARSLAREWSTASRHRDAVTLARRLKDTDGSEANWRLLLESLIASRDQLGAALEADALEQALGNDTDALEASTRALLRTARHTAAEDSGERARETGLIAELIGREAEFTSLMAAWETARSGHRVMVRLVGSAGLGKTRLLNDFAARLRTVRTRAIVTRARPADRGVPFAHVADIAGALAALKGAAGISPAHASALVALNPSLSSVFPAAPDRRHGDDAFLHRVLAMQELITVIAEESPVALLLDDHHWADPESRRLIAAVVARLEHVAVLIVVASRPGYSEIASGDATRIDVLPLTGDHMAGLLSSIAELPREPWSEGFCSMLHDVSGGSPLLALETLHSLIERRLLAIEDGRWSVTDPAALTASKNAANAIALRVRASSAEERHVLAALALIGAPAPVPLIGFATSRPVTEVAGTLMGLETRGLVAGNDGEWWPSHDLLSESFVDQLAQEEREAMQRRLGRALMAADSADESAIARAGSHFSEAGARTDLIEAFVRWAHLRRTRGDGRPIRSLARAFSPDLDSVAGMWRHVPLSLRFPRWRGTVLVAATIVLSAFGISRATAPDVVDPDAMLMAWYDSAGTNQLWSLPVRRTDLVSRNEIVVGQGAQLAMDDWWKGTRLAISPDGKAWAGDMTFPDSGDLDVFIRDVSGRMVARIYSPDDDLGASWSPDGKALAFAKGRFEQSHHGDIATFDLATKQVRQLTSGDDIDRDARWSPLGTSIAFVRVARDGSGDRICEMDPHGLNVECVRIPGTTNLSALGWYDDRNVIISLTDSNPGDSRTQAFRIIDVRDTSTSRTFKRSPLIAGASLSPDGKWLACGCQITSQGVIRWTIFPVDNPELQAEIVRDRLTPSQLSIAWLGNRRPNTYIERLEIDRRANGIQPINAALRLRATGYRADGRMTEDVPVRWAIIGGDAARIEENLLIPVHAGTVRVSANAGGWVSAEADLQIGEARTAELKNWDWSRPLEEDWIPYGRPAPLTATDTNFGRALLPNGDGSYLSGVVSREVFNATKGLVVALDAAIRIDSTQWQMLDVAFLEEPDGAPSLPTFDDVSPPALDRRTCSVRIPRGEGIGNQRQASVGSNHEQAFATLPRSVSSGAALKLVLQLFPDGSCGAAIDGKPVAHMRAAGTPIRRARLTISGQSMYTRVAIGRVDLKAGTSPDIEWRDPPLR